jgi:type I restriction enzyme R subunit
MAQANLNEKSLEAKLVEGLCASGWMKGQPSDYNANFAIDLPQLQQFIRTTQPELIDELDLMNDSPKRTQVLSRIQGEITNRGVIDVLRNGVQHNAHTIFLMYGIPTPGNAGAGEKYKLNRFTVTRQIHFSPTAVGLSLDVVLSLNGLPVITFELKNSLTKQTYQDAIIQYKNDRDPAELIFKFKRAIAHFALDDSQAWFTTKLDKKSSWFLPFNQGWNDGAGNPPNPNGLKTSYIWEKIFTPDSLMNIIENFAQVVEEKNAKTGKKKYVQIFPRFHQLDVVRKVLADVESNNVGKRYLIQHSAGSGKSNSIAWLAHQLISLQQSNEQGLVKAKFDSIIVVTDRTILDRQIRDTIKNFSQVSSTVGHAESSSDLKDMIESGKKIIITTIQKFPYIVDAIGTNHRTSNFAIIIDEAHSSQGGKAAAAVAGSLTSSALEKQATADQAAYIDDEEPDSDHVQDLVNEAMEKRKALTNASYFAFTATPKNKTLEMFGVPFDEDGKVKHRPFHTYTMKQAIDEGFILDVLKAYTPVQSYYKLIKTVEADPEFDIKRAKKKLRKYVEGHEKAIQMKAEIMIDHFLEQVIGQNKIGGQARAMVVCGSVERAIDYYHAITKYLSDSHSPYKAIVAFSGEREYGGVKITEATLNGFPSNDIAQKIIEDPYRLLVVADKFQTGYDEPLLHTMYVDKPLSGIKAVQTLSRLNRSHPLKHDVFVLDFQNNVDVIAESFADYYRTTILSDQTDPNKLHDMKTVLDSAQVYTNQVLDEFAKNFLSGADRDQLDPYLDHAVQLYLDLNDEDEQVKFKGTAKAFTRTYAFLSSILPFTNSSWEKLSIFLNFLVLKLPAPIEEDLSKGILDNLDMDSYRVERQTMAAISLADTDAEIHPFSVGASGANTEPELDKLSSIIQNFNDLFGNIAWTDADRISRIIAEDVTVLTAQNQDFVNAKANSDKQNARIAHDYALDDVMVTLMNDHTELFKQFMDNPDFRKWLQDRIFEVNYSDE